MQLRQLLLWVCFLFSFSTQRLLGSAFGRMHHIDSSCQGQGIHNFLSGKRWLHFSPRALERCLNAANQTHIRQHDYRIIVHAGKIRTEAFSGKISFFVLVLFIVNVSAAAALTDNVNEILSGLSFFSSQLLLWHDIRKKKKGHFMFIRIVRTLLLLIRHMQMLFWS